jgi:heme exporter protein D
MDAFESWTTFEQMSLFAGIVIVYCVTLTALAVWVAHRQNCGYEAERLLRQRRKRRRKAHP